MSFAAGRAEPAKASVPRETPRGFDFTAHMRQLCEALTGQLPELGYIAMPQVAIRVCQTRRSGQHGIHASLSPLRFAGGERQMLRRGRRWELPNLHDAAGNELLYLLSFYLPRFCNQPWREKLATVCHELWHIGPNFDGDIRRHAGRCYAHGPSEARYHRRMQELAAAWLATNPPPAVYEFLQHDFATLRLRHGGVYGQRIATPRMVGVPL